MASVCSYGKRHAPDLRASLDAQVLEELGEAVDQVALGDHHVDGQLDAQLAIELRQPVARRLDVRLARRRIASISRSCTLIVTITPLSGRRARYLRSSARNSAQPTLSDVASESCVV